MRHRQRHPAQGPHRPHLSPLHACFALTLALVGACAARPAQSPATIAMPPDFGIAIAVPAGLGGQDSNDGQVPSPPAYYLLDTDGVLRASLGQPRFDAAPPPRVRTLSRSQVEAIWRDLEISGVLSAASVGDPVGDASQGVADRAGIGVWWSANGRRRSFLIAPQGEGPAIGAVARTIDKLEELAWSPGP